MAEQRKTKPFSLRLTADERATLEREAGRLNLGSYIRSRLFVAHNADVKVPRRKNRTARERAEIASALAKLGHSGLSESFRDLARAARSGSLPLTPETNAALTNACSDVSAMKTALMRALGLKER